MNMQTDSSNQPYTAVECYNKHIRLTYVKNSGWKVPAVRIQVREGNGHLRQGPEIPVEIMGTVASSLIDLLIKNGKSISQDILAREILKAILK
ncbi:hypothetical protein [Candidatus Spongiihabitans sp.]|uniref:hypothetical protein n=1 Tax=Candidatus Spongiihabitans sp. TaxID=3101308 RepID=UPI003C6FBA54